MNTLEEINELLKTKEFDFILKEIPSGNKKLKAFVIKSNTNKFYKNGEDIFFKVKSVKDINCNELLESLESIVEYNHLYKELDEEISFDDQLRFVGTFIGQYSYGNDDDQLENIENLVTSNKIFDSLCKLKELEKLVKEQEAKIKKLSSELISIKKKDKHSN